MRKDTTMPDILHRISIGAPQAHVHDLIATTEGVARWWTGRPLGGESSVGSRLSVYFGDADQPAAVMEGTSDKLDEVARRVDRHTDHVRLAPRWQRQDDAAVQPRPLG